MPYSIARRIGVEHVAAADAPDARDVVADPPREQALHVRRRHPHAAAAAGRCVVPRHLVGAVAEHRRIQLRIEVQLVELVRVVDDGERAFGIARPRLRVGRIARRIDGEVERAHQVRRRLVDDRLRVVEDEPPLRRRARQSRRRRPLVAVVERQVIGVAPHPVRVHLRNLLRECGCGVAVMVISWSMVESMVIGHGRLVIHGRLVMVGGR